MSAESVGVAGDLPVCNFEERRAWDEYAVLLSGKVDPGQRATVEADLRGNLEALGLSGTKVLP